MGLERTFDKLKKVVTQEAADKKHQASGQLELASRKILDSPEDALITLDAARTHINDSTQIDGLIAFLDETQASIRKRFQEAGIIIPPEEETPEEKALKKEQEIKDIKARLGDFDAFSHTNVVDSVHKIFVTDFLKDRRTKDALLHQDITAADQILARDPESILRIPGIGKARFGKILDALYESGVRVREPGQEQQQAIPQSEIPINFLRYLDSLSVEVSPEIKTILAFALDEAKGLNHNCISTEHILLGLISEKGNGARVLENLRVEPSQIVQALMFIVGKNDEKVRGHIELTLRAKKVMELAMDESRRRNKNIIRSEDVLLGLLREGEGIAANVLESLGAQDVKARKAVTEMFPTNKPSQS